MAAHRAARTADISGAGGEVSRPLGEFSGAGGEFSRPLGEFSGAGGEVPRPLGEFSGAGGEFSRPMGEFSGASGEVPRPLGEFSGAVVCGSVRNRKRDCSPLRASADVCGVRDPQDQLELRGIRIPPAPDGAPRAQDAASNSGGRKWKSIWFRCCHVYGRMYRNQMASAYIGHCPRCGARVSARIGPGGTSRRMFEAG